MSIIPGVWLRRLSVRRVGELGKTPERSAVMVHPDRRWDPKPAGLQTEERSGAVVRHGGGRVPLCVIREVGIRSS